MLASTYRSNRTTFQQLYRDILEEVEFADSNGFDAVWFAEHHLFPYGGAIPSVPVLATAAAERTRRIRLGSGCLALSEGIAQGGFLAQISERMTPDAT